MNKQSYDMTKKYHIDLFGSKCTIKKLFKQEVTFDTEYMNIIPYLMEALNENFNVVRIKSNTDYVYALTIIEEVKKTFNLSIFEEALYFYRNWNEIEIHNNKRDIIKKKYRYTQKKLNKSEFECKEKLV